MFILSNSYLTGLVTFYTSWFLLVEKCIFFILRTAEYRHLLWVIHGIKLENGHWENYRGLYQMYIVQSMSSAQFREVVGLPVAELTILLPTFAFQNLLRPPLV